MQSENWPIEYLRDHIGEMIALVLGMGGISIQIGKKSEILVPFCHKFISVAFMKLY